VKEMKKKRRSKDRTKMRVKGVLRRQDYHAPSGSNLGTTEREIILPNKSG